MPTRILLVEDNPGDALIFREKLNESDLDYELIHTPRLAEGLTLLEEETFDIVMCDLSLPDASGLETVVRVRERAPDAPLIVLTGLDDATAAAQAKQAGAVDYLVKWYVDGPSLARYIRYAIAQYRMQMRGEMPSNSPLDDADEGGDGGLETTPAAEVPGEMPKGDAAGSKGQQGEADPEGVRLSLGTVLESSPDGLAVVGPGKAILYANARARSWIGNGDHYPWTPELGLVRVHSDGEALDQQGTSMPLGEDDTFVLTLRPASTAEGARPTPVALSQAVEASLSFIEQTKRESEWLADVLRTALDLHQHVNQETALKREPIDLAEMAQQANREHRSTALAHGLPLRVTTGRKKVMAVGDRVLTAQLFRRLILDALHGAQGGGVEVEVDVDGLTSTISVLRETRPDEERGPVTSMRSLAREVVKGLARRLQGGCEITQEPGREITIVRLPGRDDDAA